MTYTLIHIQKLEGVPLDDAWPEDIGEKFFLVVEEEDIRIPWKGTVRESILAWACEEILMEATT